MNHITDRLFEKKWGVFNHYLYNMVAKPYGKTWGDALSQFDVKKISDQLRSMGAGYYFITLCQGTKHLLCKNKTYNSISGCTDADVTGDRDIVSELYDELSKYDIDLYLYFPSDGPHCDKEFGEKFGFYYETDDVYKFVDGKYYRREPHENKVLCEKRLNRNFVDNWSSVLREYSLSYGDKIRGWWFDGFYDFFGFNPEWIKPFYEAAKCGNPKAVTTFNNGVKPYLYKGYADEEYTSGEFNELEFVPDSRFVSGLQSHILAPLGTTWGQKDARYDNEYMKNYIKTVNDAGGVVTVDVGVCADGSYSVDQLEALKMK